jgi:hypothetical protein
MAIVGGKWRVCDEWRAGDGSGDGVSFRLS